MGGKMGDKKKVVGVVGLGVVGSAVARAFGSRFDMLGHDKHKPSLSMGEVADFADMVFVCVPTSTLAGGAQDLDPLRDVLGQLEALDYPGPVIVKSTVAPGTMDHLQQEHPSLYLVHNPEFLTERNAEADFWAQPTVLLSGHNPALVLYVAERYRELLPESKVLAVYDFKTTELAKYIHNTMLATKLAFMNEVYDYAQAIGTDYESAVAAAVAQGVVGATHVKVPGPDGKRGFGGMCFVKDTMALERAMRDARARSDVLSTVIEANREMRPEAYDGREKTGYVD
jgi:UDPglucose 6-dehydrogenase